MDAPYHVIETGGGIDTVEMCIRDRIYTNLYGASLLMDDVMEQVSDFSREISQDPGFLSLISQYQQADAGSDQRQKARSQLSLALSQYVGQLRTLDSIYLMFPETETVVTMLPGQKELSFSHHYAQQLYQMYYDVFESPIVWHLLPSAGGGSRMLSHIRPVSGPAQQEKCILICNLKAVSYTHLDVYKRQPPP